MEGNRRTGLKGLRMSLNGVATLINGSSPFLILLAT